MKGMWYISRVNVPAARTVASRLSAAKRWYNVRPITSLQAGSQVALFTPRLFSKVKKHVSRVFSYALQESALLRKQLGAAKKGGVITVFRKGREWEAYRSAKQQRRSLRTAI